MTKVEYENQFFLAPIKGWTYHENGKPIKGWDSTHKLYSTGGLIWREAVLSFAKTLPNVECRETTLLYVCDSYDCPVGPMRDLPHDMLIRNNIIFPKELRDNGFDTWDEGMAALGKIERYYKTIKTCKIKKSLKKLLIHLWHPVMMSEEAERKRSMSDTFEKEARQRESKDSLRNALLLDDQENP